MRPADISGRSVVVGRSRFELRPVDAARHRDLVRTWMHDPEIEPYWEMAWSMDRIGGYLHDLLHSGHSNPYLGVVDGIPMSYWELYRADHDRLADYYPARDGDLGVHLLIGPAADRGRGLGTALLRVVVRWQLGADAGSDRVLAEPDQRNERSVRAFLRAGFRQIGEVDLPEKRAALMVLDRDELS